MSSPRINVASHILSARVHTDEMRKDDHTVANRSTYDRIAAAYTARQRSRRSGSAHGFTDFEAAFLGSLARDSLVADMGCGPALDAARFAEKGCQAIAIDLSLGMLAMAPRSMAGRLSQADLRHLPILSGCLDGIWSCAALLHLPEEQTGLVLAEFRRALRPGGYLGLITALGEGSRFEDVGYVPGERRWFVYRPLGLLFSELSAAGFQVELDERIEGSREWLAILSRAA